MYRIEKFPSLKKAYIEMSYANGGQNAGRTEQDAIADSQAVLFDDDTRSEEMLIRFDTWIASLPQAEVLVLVDGEEEERMQLLANSGLSAEDAQHLDDLLNDLFDVC